MHTILSSHDEIAPLLSGVTMNPFVEASSLMGGDGGRTIGAPNFISDCFFLSHILISLMFKKVENFYMKNNEAMNKAIGEKNYQQFDDLMAAKLCMDVHMFGKNTIVNYRSLFTFTNALIIC